MTKDKDEEDMLKVISCRYAQFYLAKKHNICIPNIYPPMLGLNLRKSGQRKENLERILYDGIRHGVHEISMSRHIGNIEISVIDDEAINALKYIVSLGTL